MPIDREENNSTNYVHPQESNLLNIHKTMQYDSNGQPTSRVSIADTDTTIQVQASAFDYTNDDELRVSDKALDTFDFETDFNGNERLLVRNESDSEQQFVFNNKNELKVSNRDLLFFNSFQYGKDLEVWDETTSGGGSATFDPNTSNVVNSVDNQQGSSVTRQTRRVVRYAPGSQNEITFAVNFLKLDGGAVKRIGLFNDENGFFFEIDEFNDDISVVLRSDATGTLEETRVYRTNWNGDKLDGSGPSGITLDFSKQQMLSVEYDWYGAGVVEFRFIIDDTSYIIHKFDTANTLSVPWAGTPFLPLRTETENVNNPTNSSDMRYGSIAVLTEGLSLTKSVPEGVDLPRIFTDNSPALAKPINGSGSTNDEFTPLLSIRLRSDRLQGVVIPDYFSIASVGGADILYRVYLDPTLDSSTVNWRQTDRPQSFVEFDAEAESFTGGTIVATGYLNPQGGQGARLNFDQDSFYQIGRNNMGSESQIFTLAAFAVSGSTQAWASIKWNEIR